MTGSNDSLTAIADDLDQLADEVSGNESRPSAEDIAARCRQAARRARAILAYPPLKATQPVVGAFAPTFTGQTLDATHPRALGDIPAAYETPEEKHRAALGEDGAGAQPIDYAALREAYLSTTIGNPPPPENIVTPENVDSFDPPIEPDPLDGA